MVLTDIHKHYRCHVKYVKKTRSERVTDTVHFKHKHITQATVTPEDTIVKALNDLTHALKERRNKRGTEEIEALQRIDEILRKLPTNPTIRTTTAVNETSQPTKETPQELKVRKQPMTGAKVTFNESHVNHHKRCSRNQDC